MTEPIAIRAGGATARSELTVPADATGTVVLADASADRRQDPRNAALARTLQDHRFATAVTDLLQPHEPDGDGSRSGLQRLTARLLDVVDELVSRGGTRGLPVALFGAGEATAAALLAAIERPGHVAAVVSRDGRPGLAGDRLGEVSAPVLFLVGEHDEVVRENQLAGARLGGPHELRIIPGAAHLFEQHDALEGVALLASAWLRAHLPAPGSATREVIA